jgi:hypothetical protein
LKFLKNSTKKTLIDRQNHPFGAVPFCFQRRVWRSYMIAQSEDKVNGENQNIVSKLKIRHYI